MGHRHSRAELLDAAMAVVAADGLARLTYGSVAQRLAIPDRTVVYYFPTKQHLVAAVLDQVGEQLRGLLGAAPAGAPSSAADLLARTWAALRGEETVAAMRLYFDVVGLAATGEAPLAQVTADVTGQWLAWFIDHLDGPAATRHDRACAVLAQLDGLLLVRQLAGTEVADAAARGLGLGPATT